MYSVCDPFIKNIKQKQKIKQTGYCRYIRYIYEDE